jgi:hypothetical protein
MPAELPISCDLRRFVQSENCRYYCAFWRRKPITESGHHVALNPRAPEAAAEGTYRATIKGAACATIKVG